MCPAPAMVVTFTEAAELRRASPEVPGRPRPRSPAPASLDPIRRVHGIPPGAAALQFSMKDPRVTATICGAAWPFRTKPGDELLALPFGVDAPEAIRVYKPGYVRGLDDSRLRQHSSNRRSETASGLIGSPNSSMASEN